MTGCLPESRIACEIVANSWWLHGVAWAYLVTNVVRLIAYLPQIRAVWHCRDGAQSLSLVTWGSSVVSQAMAVLYGALVTTDLFLVAVSVINMVCCSIVVLIATRRRTEWTARQSTVFASGAKRA